MTTIARVEGRRIWDSRGRPTVEIDVTLADGSRGRGMAPAGASMGSGEALELRDGGERLGGYDVRRAVELANTEVRALLVGQPIADQAQLDALLVAADGTSARSRLGGNTLIAASLALLNARAASRGVPLWRMLQETENHSIPVPEIQIFGGGAHARGRCDIQDFLVVPCGALSYAEGLEWVAEVYACAGRRLARRGQLQGVADEGGYWPAFQHNEEGVEELTRAIEEAGFAAGGQVAIALDAAASQWRKDGQYRWQLESRDFTVAQLLDEYGRWLDRYPIVSIEDPLAEDDHDGMREFTRRFGGRIQVVGDDYLVTSAARIEQAARAGICNTVLIKPNQAGTVTETAAAVAAAKRVGYRFIVSARSGETEDATMVHLALGWGADGFKVGSFTRSERMAKWNEMLRIEESMGRRAGYRGAEPFLSRPAP
ncbi:MAG: phosphopyruvate hydratase [Betaproteobacteria bacterium]|nr:phosphopyruvate hydratase [Betaproteobacteria bacterium]